MEKTEGRVMTLKEFAFTNRLSYRTAKRMLRDGRLRRVPGPLLRGFDVEHVPLCPPTEIAKNTRALYIPENRNS